MADLGVNMAVSLKMSMYTEVDFARAFNLWMDDYTNNPQKFEETATTAHRHLQEKLDGKEPTYGEEVTATLFAYCDKAKENV